ncbi:MAG: hypothetical protein QOC66_3331, partial [Pseudonocardiales bacterium]|nr:hypothetical protein [Pseudonocardiales bacterium]
MLERERELDTIARLIRGASQRGGGAV